MTSIRSLRHLRLVSSSLTPFFPLLSFTRALVDLTLSINTVFCLEEGASLLTHLQCIPHLQMPPATSVLLAELTYFRFFGECAEMEWFVAGLVTPSLQELHISVFNTSNALYIPHLFKFIRVGGISFFAARLTFSEYCLTTSLFAHPHSDNGPPSKIVTITTQFGAHLDNRSGCDKPLDTPINGNSESTLDIFPSLEEIVLYTSTSICGTEHRCRPVKVFWNTDGKVPRYFTTAVEAGGW
ncbi:hypothetical protein BJV77DRAFT_1023227 [Russula vinacea]|nr:hypothetical protein BJV77DRAFT_1023227 [Russula vinacea]